MRLVNLSKPQLAIYEMDRYGSGAIASIAGDIFFKSPVTANTVRIAVHSLLRNCETLRTQIVMQGDEPMQKILPYTEENIDVLHFDTRAEYEDWAKAQAKKPLDVFGKLYRFYIVTVNDRTGVFCSMHHIIGDAWTMGLIAERLCEYAAGGSAKVIEPYLAYLKAEQKYLTSEKHNKDKAYWLSTYDNNPEVAYLNEKQAKTNTANRIEITLPKEQSDFIKTFCAANNVSEYALFLSAVSAYFYRVTGRDAFYIGTPVLNRSTLAEKNTAGAFISTVPLCVKVEEKSTFSQLTESIIETVSKGFRHQKYHYSELLKTLRAERTHTDVLFDTMVSFQNIKIGGDAQLNWYHCGEQAESLQIHIDDRNNDGIYHINYDYQTEKFTQRQIERMHEHVLDLLFDGLTFPKKKVSELAILSPAEYHKVVYEFNDTAADYPKDKTVHQLFEEQVEITPNKTALIACDRTLTYTELNEQANRIAHGLIEKGVKNGDIVAFMLPRRSYLIAVMFGILKAGATYLPIDPVYPKERIDFMLADSNAKFCVTEKNVDELLAHTGILNHHVKIPRDSLCYCIYTSGSTGKPKGTLISHTNVVSYCGCGRNNMVHLITKENYKSIVATATVGFDIFVTESILPLLNGLKIIFADENQSRVQNDLNELLKATAADVLQTTPSKMKLLIADNTKTDYLKNLKAILLGGEVFDETLYKVLVSLTAAKVFNIYGPTETTVWATKSEINSSDIHIGKPIANAQIYILDKNIMPVPIGAVGEMCIAGDCVGAGYLNRPELTAEKFVSNPFGKGKMYKTGDLARWREDGNIEYVGRNDFQVKIRGLRIELGEIENALAGIEGIASSVVIVRKDNTGRQLICAFYTGEFIESSAIRGEISKALPKYMVPHIITHLDEMPMTTSGKVSRNSLPEVDLEKIVAVKEYVPPVTETEKTLCSLMAKTLNANKIGLNDDFFELGADSLKAIELVSKAHAEGLYFALQNVFDYPTIKMLCDHMSVKDKQHSSYKPEDFEETHKLISGNILHGVIPEKTEIGDILITGATGFLGIHVLAEFLENEKGVAYCLVRGNDKEECATRLMELLKFYFDDKYTDEIGKRIIPICADITKDNLKDLGIPKVNLVIHTAASVKHYGSYKYFHDINVQGTINVIGLANKYRAKLLHISTLSVSGNSMADQFDAYRSEEHKDFFETDLFIDQPLDNVYIRSKFEAEKAVLEAMAEGLQANILRVGNLTSRFSDAKFQKNYTENAFLGRVKAALELGLFPDYLLPLYAEFSPVDCAATAVIKVAQHFNNRYNTFHINSHKPIYFDKLLEILVKLSINMKIVTATDFSDKLKEIAMATDTAYIYEAFAADMDEENRLVYDSNIQIANDFTVWYLNKLGFDWPEIDLEYLRKYIDYFRNLGYLGV